MTDPLMIAAIIATFVLAGTVKGVIGMGLPTVSLGLLTVATDLPTAMALMIVPSFVTNVWQGVIGGHLKSVLRRLWPFFACATVTVGFGAIALTQISLSWLSALLGALLIVYASLGLLGIKLTISTRHHGWTGWILGALNGLFTGMTGSSVFPGVMYLQAIDLGKDALIQAMGILFALSAVALALALQSNNLYTNQLGLLSLTGLIPALLGMFLGQKIRKRMSEAVFRRVFLISVLMLGAYILVTALI